MGFLLKLYRAIMPKVTNSPKLKKKEENENKLIVYEFKIDDRRFPDQKSVRSVALKIDKNFKKSRGHMYTFGNKPQILASPGGITFVYMLTTTAERAKAATKALAKLCEPYEVK